MLRMGVEPNLAHLVSYQLSVDKKGYFKNKLYGDHQSIHSQHLDKSGVKNFREGRLPPYSKYNTKTYQEILTYRGLYGMWNDSGRKAGEMGLCSLKFSSNVEVAADGHNRDPFNLIVKLGIIKPKRTILVAIEEGLQSL